MFDLQNLHHAYVIEGHVDEALKQVKKFLEDDLKVKLQGNIDLFERAYSSFGIEDAREIKDVLLEKAIGKYKIFLLIISSMTSQSGNALLKALEEPSPGTHFFIIVPNAKRLLPTLLSRVSLIKLGKKKGGPSFAKATAGDESPLGLSPEKFLKSSGEKRMEEVKKILDLYDKEKIAKQDIVSFFKEVLEEYRQKKNYDPSALKNALVSFDYMSDQSSSLKVLMEYISLVLV